MISPLDALTAALLGSSAWWLPPPPLQCDRAPTKLYTIEYVAPGQCGGASLACMQFRRGGVKRVHMKNGSVKKVRMPDSCRIMLVPSPYEADHFRHEKAHCNCPNWIDE